MPLPPSLRAGASTTRLSRVVGVDEGWGGGGGGGGVGGGEEGYRYNSSLLEPLCR